MTLFVSKLGLQHLVYRHWKHTDKCFSASNGDLEGHPLHPLYEASVLDNKVRFQAQPSVNMHLGMS